MTPPIPPEPEATPTVVSGDTDAVAFLDAPGVAARGLFDTVDDVLGGMPDGAILTVYTDDPTVGAEAAEWCTSRDVELLAIISHEHHGTTLTLRRTSQSSPGGAPGRRGS